MGIKPMGSLGLVHVGLHMQGQASRVRMQSGSTSFKSSAKIVGGRTALPSSELSARIDTTEQRLYADSPLPLPQDPDEKERRRQSLPLPSRLRVAASGEW